MSHCHLHFLITAFFCFTACERAEEQAFLVSTAFAIGHTEAEAPPTASNIIFQSTDGGQTWQDISAGLPVDFEAETFSIADGSLFLSAKQGIFNKDGVSKNSVWGKEQFLTQRLSNIAATPTGMVAYSSSCRFVQKLNGMDFWTPAFTNFTGQFVRAVFTANDDSIFIGTDNGIFKSDNNGKTWKHVMQEGWMIKMAESDGVLLCTSERGILRSTDGGEHWDVVLNEGGVGIAVEVIKGGFAAITYNNTSKTRRVRISMDGGQTWQPIDAGLPPSPLISSIQQVGNYFYCGHPEGVFRSADQGKSWQLLLPTIGEKVFNLSVSGNVLYAVLLNGGC